MIDEDRTLQLYGYTSDELKPRSGKPIVAVCDECGKYRVLRKAGYRDVCRECNAHHTPSKESRLKMMCDVNKSKTLAIEHRQKISDANKGKAPTIEHRQKLSAAMQGIPHEDWESFSSDGKYCHKFNESCREQNREKYGRRCFLCGKDESDNGRRLSVHHVDMNKDQGCNDHVWKLVPLCQSCHRSAHNKMWQARIEYLITETFK